jgi:nucleotide-binding universal stress UspA family protein
VELLVMGTVCRTGVAGFLIGNTAEGVLDQINCSVLTLKPEGFKTPVRAT